MPKNPSCFCGRCPKCLVRERVRKSRRERLVTTNVTTNVTKTLTFNPKRVYY